MTRRKAKAPRRRRSKAVSLLNVGEALAQASIVTNKFLGVGAVGFIMDAPDAPGISIRDAIKYPQKLQNKLMQTVNLENVIEVGIESAVTNLGFRFMRRALRRPVNQLNRQIMAPLGLGVKL